MAATVVFATLTIVETPGWSSYTVELPGWGAQGCYFANSTSHVDHFCIAAHLTPGGEGVNGTFDHGPGTQASAVAFGTSGPCATPCPSLTWVAPDDTGRIVWSFTLSVTLQVRD